MRTRLFALSILAALATITLKMLAWWLTDSVGLLSDALESFVNLAAALFGLTMVTVASSPPDEDHPFGHEKAEYFSSGFEGILILAVALAIMWPATLRLMHPQPLEKPGLGLTLSIVSSCINGLLAWRMLQASRLYRSIALEADARHLLTDVWTSVGVVAALIAVPITGWLWLDPLVAIAVAANIAREGLRLVRRSVGGLMDEAMPPEERAQVDAVLARYRHDHVRIDHVRTRVSGHRRFVELHMHVPGEWPLARAAALRQELEGALLGAVAGAHATIQILPMNREPLSEAAMSEGTPQ